MQKDKITSIVQALNNLLVLSSPYATAFEWDVISEKLRSENLKIEIIESRTYYLHDELNHIHEKKNEAAFEAAAKLRIKEKELLTKYANTEAVIKKQEPSFFLHKDNRILAYLSKSKATEKLIRDLIEAYMLKKD